MAIRLVIADDHPIVLGGLVHIFANEADLQVVATARNGDEALEAVGEFQPDVLVLDLRMPVKDGLAVLREIKRAAIGVRVVVLTAESSDDAVEAVRLGARGIVLKHMAPQLLVQCIREVHSGGQWLEKSVAARAINMLLGKADALRAQSTRLTGRQLQIARMVVEGLPSKVIARKLAISEGTAKLHLHHIYERLGIDGRMALVRYMQSHTGN
jgi:two-component system nitrate/nitrite response regulator NarL